MKRMLLYALSLTAGLVALLLSFSMGISAQNAQQVTINETEFALSPAKITVTQGQAVQFTVVNAGKFDHNLTVELPAQKIEQKLFDTNLKPGETRTTQYTFTAAGEWEMYCPVDAHEDRGMKGTIVVEAAGNPSGLPQTGDGAPVGPLALLGLILIGGGVFFLQRARMQQS